DKNINIFSRNFQIHNAQKVIEKRSGKAQNRITPPVCHRRIPPQHAWRRVAVTDVFASGHFDGFGKIRIRRSDDEVKLRKIEMRKRYWREKTQWRVQFFEKRNFGQPGFANVPARKMLGMF